MNIKKKDFLEEDFEDENIYTEDGIDLALEDDSISSEEAGFMKGFLDEE